MSKLTTTDGLAPLIRQIASVIEQARGHVRQSVNHAMVVSYWEIGRLIVEHEQQGRARAAYGQRQLAELSVRLTAKFGKGFTANNLRYMRQFFQTFPIRHALRGELSWAHYRALLRVENPAARDWYVQEAITCRTSWWNSAEALPSWPASSAQASPTRIFTLTSSSTTSSSSAFCWWT